MGKDPNELNLVPAIIEIEAQIRKIEAEYNKKLQPYKNSLEQLRKINTACERCNGIGKILRSLLEEILDEKLPNERDSLLRRANEIKGGLKNE